MTKEQRKHPRVPTTIVTELHTPDSVISKGKGCVTDLGLGGMGFETESDFEENTDIFLTFNLPIEVQGKITYVSKKGALKKYGIKFTKLGEAEKLNLERYITAKFKK